MAVQQPDSENPRGTSARECATLSGVYEVGVFESSECVSLGWQSTVASLHGALSIRSAADGPYAGRLVWQASRTYSVVRWRGAPEQLRRGAAELRDDPRATSEVLVPVRGTVTIEAGGSELTVAPGEFLVLPMDRSMVCTHETACEAVCFIAPAPLVRSRQETGDDILRADRRTGLGSVAWSMLEALIDERTVLDAAGFDAACDRLLDLVLLAAGRADGGSSAAPNAELVAAVRREIRRRVADVTLDGATVAAALGWSLRHVQAALARSGTTVGEIIREERLDRAWSMLVDPHQRAPVSRIAAECGFSTHSMFSTAFRARFGVTPSEARAAVR
jgi:AraC-like DNA-binding protein